MIGLVLSYLVFVWVVASAASRAQGLWVFLAGVVALGAAAGRPAETAREAASALMRAFRDARNPSSLAAFAIALGLAGEDIDLVILSHFDWDHAGGVVMKGDDGGLRLTFPKARHVLQRQEWEDVPRPHVRAMHTYWPVNRELLSESGMLELLDGTKEVAGGVTVWRTGGHNRGHQIVTLESRGEKALHLADLMPTHAHFHPLWVMPAARLRRCGCGTRGTPPRR